MLQQLLESLVFEVAELFGLPQEELQTLCKVFLSYFVPTFYLFLEPLVFSKNYEGQKAGMALRPLVYLGFFFR